MKIAILGQGAMGARMAARLAAAGHDIRAWNRSPFTPAENIARTPTPAAAAEDADVVLSMVRDDDASFAVWCGRAGALEAMSDGAIGVDCSTVSIAHAQHLAETFANAGKTFVEAPVLGSRPQAEAGKLIFLCGGVAEAVARLEPVFSVLGAATHHAGPFGAGATVKLLANALFGIQVAAVAELLPLALRGGVTPARAAEILGATPVMSLAAKAAADGINARAFAPQFPIDLVAKDFGLIGRLAGGGDTPLADAARGVYARAARADYGALNITAIAELYRAKTH